MGRTPGGYITVTKAASILQCDTKRVHSLCDHGLIRRIHDGNRSLVRAEDIAEIRRLNLVGEVKPGELLRRVLFLERQYQRLEAAVNILFEANKMKVSRFVEMTDDSLISLYENVRDDLGEDKWPRARLLSYAELFIKITELEIDRLNSLLEVEHSWLTFYQLLLSLTRFINDQPDLSTDLELQQIRNYLAVGRQNISTIAVLFTAQATQLGPARRFMERLASNDIDVFDDLAKKIYGEKENGKNPYKKHTPEKPAKMDL